MRFPTDTQDSSGNDPLVATLNRALVLIHDAMVLRNLRQPYKPTIKAAKAALLEACKLAK